MTPFERLFCASDPETLNLVHRMVGKKEMALYMAKTIATSMGTSLDADEVAKIFDITKQSAYNKIRTSLTIEKAELERDMEASCFASCQTFGMSRVTESQWIRTCRSVQGQERGIEQSDCENVSTDPVKAELRLSRDARGRIAGILRLRIRLALKVRDISPEKTLDLVGCSVPALLSHLESQFTDGMSWENYPAWHIDHKRPCASFDLLDLEQQRLCFNYKNLQPLWAKDNMKKGARYDAP